MRIRYGFFLSYLPFGEGERGEDKHWVWWYNLIKDFSFQIPYY